MSYSRTQLQNIPESSYNSNCLNYNNPGRGSFKTGAQRPDSYYQYVSGPKESYPYHNGAGKRNSIFKLQNLRKQFHEVIDLCKGENIDVKGELNNVVEVERDIYNMLIENPQQLQRIASNQSIVQQPQTLQRPSQFLKRQELTPIMEKNKNYVPQSVYYIPNFSQVGAKEQNLLSVISNQKLNKPEYKYFPVQDQYFPTSDQAALKNTFNLLKKSNQVQLNDDAFRLIQQIQRKAFEEIQKVRKQKIQLMQKLNQEIRNTNEERRKNLQLQHQLFQLKSQFQRPDGSSLNQNQNFRNLQMQIRELENQLNRISQLNNKLQVQLSQRGVGVSGMEQLLRQGELIRQDTIRLLRLKQFGPSNTNINQRMFELERQLGQQRSQKQSLLQEIRNLRQRVNGGNHAMIGHSKIGQNPDIKSVIRMTSPPLNVNSNLYQDMLLDMKRITGY